MKQDFSQNEPSKAMHTWCSRSSKRKLTAFSLNNRRTCGGIPAIYEVHSRGIKYTFDIMYMYIYREVHFSATGYGIYVADAALQL